MNYKEICDLINTVSNSKLTSFEIEIDGVHLKMGKEEKVHNLSSANKEEVSLKRQLEKEEQDKSHVENYEDTQFNKTIEFDENIEIVESPIVGTFYATPSPDKEAFVQIGSMVKKGDTLCIIEAMKLMNEIEAEVDGEIVDILVKNEHMVEYGEPLFKIRKKA